MTPLNVTDIVNKISIFLNKRLATLARETGFVRRKSKLKPRAFVETLIVSCLNENTTYEAQCNILKQKSVKITKQGLAGRINNKTCFLLSALLDEALVLFQSECNNMFELLHPFNGLKMHDSSGIELPSRLNSFFKGHGGGASQSSLKLQVLFDDTSSSIDGLWVTDGRRNDQSFTHHLDSIQVGALYLQDLGYFNVSSFRKIVEGGAYFLSRYLPQTLLYSMTGEELELLSLLRSAKGQYFEQEVLLGKKEKLPVRLIAERLDEAKKEKRHKNIYKSHKKGKPSKLILELAGWSIYITNIPTALLVKEHMHTVYTLRWQIELFFKLCKQYAMLDKIRGTTLPRVLCELYTKLIVIILFLHLCSPIRWLNNREVSFPKAYQLFKTSAPLLLSALSSAYLLKKYIISLVDDFLAFALKDKKTNKKASSYQQIKLLAQPGEAIS